MRVLVADNGGPLAAAVVRALAGAHDVRAIAAADALDRDRAADATAGREVVVHFPLLVHPAASALEAPDALTRLDIAGRATYNLITTAGEARRFVLIGTLHHYHGYPAGWLVTERWAPRPSAHIDDLAPYTAELVVRETARVLPLQGIALRLGEVHVEDAVQAVERALAFGAPGNGWWVFHIVGAGRNTRFPLAQAGEPSFGYVPKHAEQPAVGAPPEAPPAPSRGSGTPAGGPPKRVVVFGAGGPIGAAFAACAAADHVLRRADLRPMAEIVAADTPQGPGAPVPAPLDPPHEDRVVDVTDPDQVLAAVEGTEAIVNLTAMRNDPVEAFRVNVLGPYNVMRAAVAKGIGRVVLSGPAQISLAGPAGYTYDDEPLTVDAPARPGTELYFVSKLLGLRIGRIFAQAYGIETPCLLIGPLLHPDPKQRPPNAPHGAYPFSVAWSDAGEAVHRALHAAPLPRRFEPLFVVADLPHGRFSNEKTKRLLGWAPKERLEQHWLRGPG